MLLLDAFMLECPTAAGKASLKAIRAAVAELAQENERLKERCAALDSTIAELGFDRCKQECDAMRRRVEGLKTAIRGAQIDLDAGETAIAARRITAALKELT